METDLRINVANEMSRQKMQALLLDAFDVLETIGATEVTRLLTAHSKQIGERLKNYKPYPLKKKVSV